MSTALGIEMKQPRCRCKGQGWAESRRRTVNCTGGHIRLVSKDAQFPLERNWSDVSHVAPDV
jgi:hypothetical protein